MNFTKKKIKRTLQHTTRLMSLFLSPFVASKAVAGIPTSSLETEMEKLVEQHELSSNPLLRLPYRQAWLEQPEIDFRPGLAQIHAVQDGFVVLAALKDDDIHNSADGFNQKTWLMGDVFEFFIQTADDVYYEIHVTPENQVLFLKWSPELFRAVGRKEASFSSALIDDKQFASSSTIRNNASGYWTVCLFLPYAKLGLRQEKLAESSLRVSFTRYDAAVGRAPVLSATPPFTKENFHQLDVWHRLAPIKVDKN